RRPRAARPCAPPRRARRARCGAPPRLPPRRRPRPRRRARRVATAAHRRRATAPLRARGRSRRLLLLRLFLCTLELLGRLAASDLGLHLRELVVDLRALRDLCELPVEVVARRGVVLERARRGQLVDRVRPCLHLLGLVLRALDRKAHVGHLLTEAG